MAEIRSLKAENGNRFYDNHRAGADVYYRKRRAQDASGDSGLQLIAYDADSNTYHGSWCLREDVARQLLLVLIDAFPELAQEIRFVTSEIGARIMLRHIHNNFPSLIPKTIANGQNSILWAEGEP